MGLFDFLKKKNEPTKAPAAPAPKVEDNYYQQGYYYDDAPAPKTKKSNYQPDSYYTSKAFEGTPFEKDVITFEQRKKTAVPSENGLYPAEILLLEYCSKGTYPGPKNGYPGFWWFEYGIRDVEKALSKLENDGFIEMGNPKDSLKGLTAAQLKEILESNGQSGSGKKDDLIKRVCETISDDVLIKAGVSTKYKLTEKGQNELKNNEYVPYLHSHKDLGHTVWSLNTVLGTGDKSNWKAILDAETEKSQQEFEQHRAENEKRQKEIMADLKKSNPELYAELKAQNDKLKQEDEIIAAVNKARQKYSEDKDTAWFIAFWEQMWANGNVDIGGSAWHFELPSAYIKVKRYDDAMKCLKKLQKDSYYKDRATSEIEKLQKKIDKQK